MLFKSKADDRPCHLGPFPLEVLPRNQAVVEQERDAAQALVATLKDQLQVAVRPHPTAYARATEPRIALVTKFHA